MKVDNCSGQISSSLEIVTLSFFWKAPRAVNGFSIESIKDTRENVIESIKDTRGNSRFPPEVAFSLELILPDSQPIWSHSAIRRSHSP